MNRFEYLAALKQALAGLPDEMVQAVVADYERRIVERSAAGQSEDEIMQALGDPAAIATEQRAAFQSGIFPAKNLVKNVEKKQQANRENGQNNATDVVRRIFSALGLTVLNLFLLGPLMACLGVLCAVYAVSLVCYGVGILVIAANLAGVSGVMFSDPFEHTVVMQQASAFGAAHGNAHTAQVGDGETQVDVGHSCVYVRAAEHPVLNGLVLGIDCVSESDGKNVVNGESRLLGGEPWSLSFSGIAMTLGGILSFLACLAASKWTWNGLRRLARMEMSVLTDN